MKSFIAQIIKLNNIVASNCSMEQPYYACDCVILDENLTHDTKYPIIKDVVLPMNSVGTSRGFSALPEVGTICELAFGYDNFTLPFIRTILPLNKQLIAGGIADVNINQSATNYHKMTATSQEVNAPVSMQLTAPQVWLGSKSENLLQIDDEFIDVMLSFLALFASHVNVVPEVGGVPLDKEQIKAANKLVEQLTQVKTRLNVIKSPTG